MKYTPIIPYALYVSGLAVVFLCGFEFEVVRPRLLGVLGFSAHGFAGAFLVLYTRSFCTEERKQAIFDALQRSS